MEKLSSQSKSSTDPAIKVLFEWEAPDRIWEPKSRLWFLGYAAVFSIIILLAAKLGYFILILGMIALLFLLFVHASVPPLIIKNKVTNVGIISRDILYKWQDIAGFWFGVKGKSWQMYLDLKSTQELPRISILFEAESDEKIFNLIAKHVTYSNPTEAGFNFLSEVLYGNYVPVNKYIQDLDQPGNEDSDGAETHVDSNHLTSEAEAKSGDV